MCGCTSAPRSPAPQIIYVGCPRVSRCPMPGSQPKTNGDLSADIRQLESALATCGLQVDAVKQCQEHHDAQTRATAPGINGQRAATAKQP
ncbi:Rz1-like lysis system protein LysC [Acerihabitans sp. TG2]|uniref:Rz1-like lysis system protein LysC n=1 Tax=Acerihabitans sp. TG2 TaxID=3096008 RepID=UPI002B22DFF7|nr:Rz1-like lysis system protein LysC [Acerihabitans sp. TG2]MEA9389558.1 Rz1-like lysis system protein LysC [Acerihabitans sp. TG2]